MLQSITLALIITILASVITLGGFIINMQDKINAILANVQEISTKFTTLAAAWEAFKVANPTADTSALEAAVNNLNTAVTNTPAP